MPAISTITSLGYILSENIQVVNNISQFSLPAANSSGTQVANFTGKKRVITLTGVHTGSGYSGGSVNAKIKAFIDDVETWINDGTQTSRIYTDGFSDTYSVLCLDFTWDYVIDSTGKINYTMTLLEGTLLGA